MNLTPGARLGHYEILGPLGAGGMGQVFRARDVTLDRPVAIKVLRDDAANDPEWLARFEREARLLAGLNHPNIATVHGLGEAEGSRYLVMEWVPGQTLAQRLARGPLPVHEALAVCKQLAEGLEAAHDRGVIHRDLKPGNVMLTPDGKVKVLDFGLARSVETLPPSADATTPYEAQTREGVVVGTPGYVAPEQACAGPTDRRCDLWSFGCVLYEALTGRRAFPGTTFADSLAAAATRRASLEALPVTVPRRVADLLRRCLQEDVSKRLRDAGDARLELEDALAELQHGAKGPAAVLVPRRRWRWWPVAAAGLLAALAFGLGQAWRTPAGRGWSGELLLGGETRAFQPRLSPDGQWLAFLVLHEQQTQVGVMKLESGEWWVLTRRRDRGQVLNVCWSPDSTRIYFDRFFDVPGGVYSVSPLDRQPAGAREVLVVQDADCPQVAADGSLVVGTLDADGTYRLNRHSPNQGLRAVGPPLEFSLGWPSAVRALHRRNAVVFCGRVLDGTAPARRQFYLLDLDRDEYRPLWDRNVLLDVVPLAVSPQDDFAWTALEAGDTFQVLRIPLTGSRLPDPLLTLTAPVWGLEADGTGGVYLDQVHRPPEVVRFPAPAAAGGAAQPEPADVERIAAPSLWRERGTVARALQLPDGRVVLPGKVRGRDRLFVARPGQDPAPLLHDHPEETAPPMTLVGPGRLAFVVGSGQEDRVRLASLADDDVRLEPVELGVAGDGLTALAGSPDGSTLYYVQSRQVYEVPADGSRPPNQLGPGDGVAVYPTTGDLLIQRFERAGVRLFRWPRPAGRPEEVEVKPGASKLVTLALGGGAIHRDGRVLLASTAKDSWFWRTAVLSPAGELRPIPVAFDGDLYPAGWGQGDQVLATGYALRSDLWRLRPVAAEAVPKGGQAP